MSELKKLDLSTVADGALPELFERELYAVLSNIDDINTNPTKVRRINIVIDFAPTKDRSQAAVSCGVTSKLAAPDKAAGHVHLVRRAGVLQAFAQDPNQLDLPLEKAEGSVRPITNKEA